MLTVYTLATCDSCRQATRWLRERNVPFTERAIRETPPPLPALRAALATHDGDVRKLFNTSGRDYRAQQLGEKLPGMTEAAALALLAANGNLVKRPFVVGPGWARAGFNAAAWEAAVPKA